MVAKGQADTQEEQEVYATYSKWVHEQVRDTNMEIETSKATIEKQDAINVKVRENVINVEVSLLIS
jgi:hypothetical protein